MDRRCNDGFGDADPIDSQRRTLDAVAPLMKLSQNPMYEPRTQAAIDDINREMDANPVSLERQMEDLVMSMRYIQRGCRSAFENN